MSKGQSHVTYINFRGCQKVYRLASHDQAYLRMRRLEVQITCDRCAVVYTVIQKEPIPVQQIKKIDSIHGPIIECGAHLQVVDWFLQAMAKTQVAEALPPLHLL